MAKKRKKSRRTKSRRAGIFPMLCLRQAVWPI